VNGNAALTASLLDHGANVNKLNDDGVTPLSATIALLYDDRRAGPTPPAAGLTPPLVPEGPRTTEEPRIGRLSVSRTNRAVVNALLNDSPLASTVYFDAAGQIHTLEETRTEKMTEEDKSAPAVSQQQPLKPPSAPTAGRESDVPSTKVSGSPGDTGVENTTDQTAGVEQPIDKKTVEEDEQLSAEQLQQQPPKVSSPPTVREGSRQSSIQWTKVSSMGDKKERITIDRDYLEETLMVPAVQQQQQLPKPSDAEEAESGEPLASSAKVSSSPAETKEEKATGQKVADEEKRTVLSKKQQPLKSHSSSAGR